MILIALVALYFGGVAMLGAIPVNSDFSPTPDGTVLCLRSNGVHTDFIVPTRHAIVDWQRAHPRPHFPFLENDLPYVAFGWGDRAFYLETPTWSDLTFGTAIVAVSGFGRSALHVEYLSTPQPDERTACTRLSDDQYRALVSYIEQSFSRDEKNDIIRIDARGYNNADAFYEARGSYSLVTTCNEWVRQGLSDSGIRAPAWSPFDGALLDQIRRAGGVSP